MRLNYNKDTGPRPSKKLLVKASALAKQGTKDHIAVAMHMRPNGATQSEIVRLLDHPHRNKIKKLLQDNKVQSTVLPDDGRSQRIKLVVKN